MLAAGMPGQALRAGQATPNVAVPAEPKFEERARLFLSGETAMADAERLNAC